MRAEVWVHEPTGTVFQGREYYLDFMRARRRDRMAVKRLQDHHARCWAILNQVNEVMRFEEIEIFFNDHHNEIEGVCSSREERYKLDTYIRIKLDGARETDTHWCARISYSYSCVRHKKAQHFWREDSGKFPSYIDGFGSVLKKMGVDIQSGGGANGRMQFPSALFEKSRFPNAEVMEILAA